MALDLQRHRLGLLHQRQLGRRFDHPAAVDRARAVDQLQPMPAQLFAPGEGQQRIDRQRRAGRKGIANQRGRIGILLPQQQIGFDQQIGLDRAPLERRADQPWCASGRQQQGDHAFARPPGKTGEIAQAGPGVDQQRIGAGFGGQGSRLFQPRHPLAAVDRGDGGRPGRYRGKLRLECRTADGHARTPLPPNRSMSNGMMLIDGVSWRTSAATISPVTGASVSPRCWCPNA